MRPKGGTLIHIDFKTFKRLSSIVYFQLRLSSIMYKDKIGWKLFCANFGFDDNCQLLCFVLFMFRNATGSVMVASSFGMPPFAHEFRAVDAQPTRRRSIMNLWTVLASSTATHSVFFIAFNQYFKIESSNSIFKKKKTLKKYHFTAILQTKL